MNHQGAKRNRGIIYKYPRTFVIVTTTAAVLMLFSKPIYDVFIRKDHIDYHKVLEDYKAEKERHGIRKES
nr:unnamed protein product [Callosobruchus chinensis]